jgi:SNF2 family DNA or RNA helicase
MKYKFRTRPYRHQVDMIRKSFDQFRQGLGVAFLAEPRTGKTKATVDSLCILHLKHNVRKVLIIAPNRVLGVWVQEIAAHSTLNIQTIVWDAKARKQPIPRMQSAYDMQVLITNFETFGTPGRRTASGRRSVANGRFKHRQLIRKWLADDPNPAAVVDEGHKLKSPSGKASNMIVSMRDYFPFRFHLTGTPVTKAKRAHDVYMQWQWVNPRRFSRWGATHDDFRNHVGKYKSYNGIPIWRGERADGMRDLQRGLHADGIVVRRADCFDLPAKLPDRIIHVPLTRDTARHYDEMASDMCTRLESGEIAEASIPIVVTLRLSQITSGHVGILEPHPTKPDKMVSRPVRVGNDKLIKLKELLEEETLENEEPVIICARFQPDLNAIERLCKRLGIPYWSIRGGMTRSATDEALKAFKRITNDACAMVVQPSAGGVGIDMSTAPHTIWFSLIPSWVDYTQMNDRNALNVHGTRATYLLAHNTVDQLVYDTLQLDGDVSRAILKRPQAILRRSTTRR